MTKDTKAFCRAMVTLVGPIVVQNLVTAAVSSADVVMLGRVGQTAVAAVSLAAYVQFVLMLFSTGVSSGLVMLAAQYWGKGDLRSIETLADIGYLISSITGAVFALLAAICPSALMHIFTNETPMVETGSQYLRIVSVSYLVMSFSVVLQAVLRSVERVKLVSAVTTMALLLNIVLNAIFIFGLCGMPRMEVRGAALATSIARVIELAVCAAAAKRIKGISLRPHLLRLLRGLSSVGINQGTHGNAIGNNANYAESKERVLLKDFIHYSLPAIGNESVWGAAFAAYSVILGHLGEDIVAAASVINVAKNLAAVACFGMAYGGAVLMGKTMGSGDMERARADANRLWRGTLIAAAIGALIVLVARPVIMRMARLSPQALQDLSIMIWINAASLVGAAVNTVLICGIFRAGGDAKFGFVMDFIIMWAVSVPLGLLSAFVLHLPPVMVYLVLFLDEFEKMPIVIRHYRSGKWLKNITRDFG